MSNGDIYLYNQPNLNNDMEINKNEQDTHLISIYEGTNEGFLLNWNIDGTSLISGGENGIIGNWDIQVQNKTKNKNKNKSQSLINKTSPTLSWKGHNKSIGDLIYQDMNIIISCSDDSTIACWDLRCIKNKENNLSTPINSFIAHTSGIYSLCNSPYDEYILLSGGQDTMIHLWDKRKLSK
jgi:WD40 repeat protein